MVGYLAFDGFTSTWQDKMFKGYEMSIYNQILYVQLCSAFVSLSSLIAFGQVWSQLALFFFFNTLHADHGCTGHCLVTPRIILSVNRL
jgi:solute carrier family 35 (adenosine 3'-phospho 5'-phosphosulfate transporter), member B2